MKFRIKIVDLERSVFHETTQQADENSKANETIFREIDNLQQKTEKDLDRRADQIISKFSEHVAELYRELDITRRELIEEQNK